MEKDILESFKEIADVIENDSSMTIRNPVLGDVVFSNGTFGNLKKKNNGGFGIKHIIEGRHRKDHCSKEQIASLLYLVKETVETISPIGISKPKINLVKNGIWVGITRNWLDTDENWVVTGFGEFDKEQKLTKEAADVINAVSAKYGYTPEFLSVGKQVGAVIASIEMITLKNQMSSINTKLSALETENVRLRQENLSLGKQLMSLACKQMKEEGKEKSKNKEQGCDRTR